MAVLSIRTALAQVEQAVHRVLRWKLLALRTTLADVATLRAYATQAGGANATQEYTPIFVTSTGVRWEWISSSTATDDGVTTAQPSDVSAGTPGRWRATTSTATGGYLTAVNYWQGESTKKEYQVRILADRPSIAIVWESSDNDPRSTIPGAIFDYPCRFSIWCVDENMRPNYEAFFGSGYGYDSNHPGAITILGDAKKVLADENKRQVGGSLTTGGLSSVSNCLDLAGGAKVIEIDSERVVEADLAERVFVLSLAIEVIASVENPDDATEHVAVTSLYGQPRIGELHGQSSIDTDNCLTSIGAYAFSPQLGFTAAPQSGTAFIDGVAVSSAPAAHTFSSLSDTYCDLNPDGTLTYATVDNENPAPSVTTGALRVGVVTTSATSITAFVYIASLLANYGGPNQIAPAPTAT